MKYDIRVEQARPRTLAAVRGSTTRAELSATIIRLLDKVWPVLREQQVGTGHNVVVYHGGLARVEAGVEVSGDFKETAEVRRSATPAGIVATTAHWRNYSELVQAYDSLARWCADNGRRLAGV